MKGSKTFQELLDYAVKMRKRGESIKNITVFLSKYTNDEDEKKEIYAQIEVLEKSNQLEIKPELNHRKVFTYSRLTVYIIILIAYFIFYLIWTKNSIAILPLVVLLFLLINFIQKGRMNKKN